MFSFDCSVQGVPGEAGPPGPAGSRVSYQHDQSVISKKTEIFRASVSKIPPACWIHPLSIFSCRATEVSVASAVLTVPSAPPVPVVLPVLVETMVLR